MKIIDTADGSNTIYLEDIDETYHSRYGAIQESMHVFLKNGFRYLLSEFHQKELKVLEIGFGTGLNAVLTAIDSFKLKIPVEYTSLEPFPLSESIIDRLNYGMMMHHPAGKEFWQKIHRTGWGEYHAIHAFFKIKKIKITVQDFESRSNSFNLLYFDAFAPNKQPEMWNKDILSKMFSLLSLRSVFVTYCAKGQVKRELSEIGFHVQTLKGPPGKKEMLRGIKTNLQQ